MASLHFITGSTAAGKTSYAQHLAETLGAFRFTLEEWVKTLYAADAPQKSNVDWMNDRILRCEALAKRISEQAIANRQTVILDFGLTTEVQRERFYKWARTNGVSFKVHFLDVPVKTRWTRVAYRNDQPNEASAKMTREQFDRHESLFEPPSDEELIENNGIRLIPEKT